MDTRRTNEYFSVSTSDFENRDSDEPPPQPGAPKKKIDRRPSWAKIEMGEDPPPDAPPEAPAASQSAASPSAASLDPLDYLSIATAAGSPEHDEMLKTFKHWMRRDPFIDVLVSLFPAWGAPGDLDEVREGEAGTDREQRRLLRAPPDARRVLLAIARPFGMQPHVLIQHYYELVKDNRMVEAFVVALAFESLVDNREHMLRQTLHVARSPKPADPTLPPDDSHGWD